MSFRYGNYEVLDGDYPRLHPARHVVPPTQGEIDVTTHEPLHRGLREVLTEELEVDTRVVLLDSAGESADHHVGGCARVRQSDATDLANPGRARHCAYAIKCIQHVAGRTDHGFTDG